MAADTTMPKGKYTESLISRKFLIEYYGYSLDYLIVITNQFTINTHTWYTAMGCSLPDTDLWNYTK